MSPRNRFSRLLTIIGGLWVLTSSQVSAHSVSTAYLSLEGSGANPELRVDLPLRDVNDVLGLDADGNGKITWGEVRAQETRIVSWIVGGVVVRRGAAPCSLRSRPLALESHADTVHVSLNFAINCPNDGKWSLAYGLLFDRDRSHRALLAIHARGNGAKSIAAVLDAERREWRDDTSAWDRFAEFVGQGMWHIWLGYDHLAFLILLLLPAVLQQRGSVWVGAPAPRAIAIRALGVVTAFTLAHSITLSLAALGIFTPPVVPIEAAIAVTVVLAGIANLVPGFAAHGARMAFGFGLIHGFGFANALQEIGLSRGGIAVPLAGFNLGVECGQLVVVGATLPVLAVLRHRVFYQRWLMPGVSAGVACVATWWLLQRVSAV